MQKRQSAFSPFQNRLAEKIGRRPEEIPELSRELLSRIAQIPFTRDSEVGALCKGYGLNAVTLERFFIPFLKGFQYAYERFGALPDSVEISGFYRIHDQEIVTDFQIDLISCVTDRSSCLVIHPQLIAFIANTFNQRVVINANLPEALLTGEEAAYLLGIEEAHHALLVKEGRMLEGRRFPQGTTFTEKISYYAQDAAEQEAASVLKEALIEFRNDRNRGR